MPVKIWMTHAWTDNEQSDIDFIAQELTRIGLEVRLDRWNIGAGRRLWEQIADFISNPDQSDAWLLIATQASLQSEPCKEELAYALDRALKSRGETFPVIALFPSSVEQTLIPPAIRTRLHISLTDVDWKERVKAAAESRAPSVTRSSIEPYAIALHRGHPSGKVIIETRPRAGNWTPVFAAVPITEAETSKPWIMVEPAGVVTGTGMVASIFEGPSQDGLWWATGIQGQATPIQSLYIWVPRLPSQLRFGSPTMGPEFTISFAKGAA